MPKERKYKRVKNEVSEKCLYSGDKEKKINIFTEYLEKKKNQKNK